MFVYFFCFLNKRSSRDYKVKMGFRVNSLIGPLRQKCEHWDCRGRGFKRKLTAYKISFPARQSFPPVRLRVFSIRTKCPLYIDPFFNKTVEFVTGHSNFPSNLYYGKNKNGSKNCLTEKLLWSGDRLYCLLNNGESM